MSYSSIQKKHCKCSANCHLWPNAGFAGYSRFHSPKDIFEKQKEKREASIKRSNAKKIDAAKIKKLAVKIVIRPVKKPIAKNSKKRLAQLKIYSALRKDYLKDHKSCQANLQGCKKVAKEIHHRMGRENHLLNEVSLFLAVCRPCHDFITEHSKEAIELGLSLSRFKINKNGIKIIVFKKEG